jgi:hypothetical protein
MKERPILFSAPMVRALLDGSKTQTRRVAKNVNHVSSGGAPMCIDPNSDDWSVKCPYGQPGDQLWVREAWHDNSGAYKAGKSQPIYYRADFQQGAYNTVLRWKPSIHMPRWASRIELEITSVRVERLQDISEADAKKEGIEPFTDFKKSGHWLRYDKDTLNGYVGNPVESYASLWESINGPGSWDLNPWVWVVEFKVAKP